MKYVVFEGARQAVDDSKQAQAEALALGPYRGGPIESKSQLVRGLCALRDADKLLAEFRRHAKAWVDEHGSIEHEGQTWGPQVQQRESAVGLKLGELLTVLADCGVSSMDAGRVEAALRRRGVGEVKATEVYAWRKV